jgi:hypothetical protein
MPKMMKVVQDTVRTFIVRLDKQLIIGMNDSDKTYWEMSFDDLQKSIASMASRRDQFMAQMKERMADMPEDQRAAMEERMKNMGGMGGGPDTAKLTATATGETKTINGFACTRYDVKRDTASFMTVWASKDVKGYADLKQDFSDFRQKLASSNPMMGRNLLVGLSDIDGFPIQSEHGNFKTVVTKVVNQATPESEFNPPSSYKKVDPPTRGMGRGPRRHRDEGDQQEQPENQPPDNNNN